ncbi:MAG: hypothetical protein Kow0031_09140 [Anaerolineae bacterium]
MNYTDKAIENAESDHLDFSEYCEVLTRVVSRADTPLTVGIFGPWGSGKTSLMHLVRESLKQQQPQPLAVWFNAWKYDQEDALWRALIIQVLAALRPVAKKSDPADRHQLEADKPETPQYTEAEQQLIKELDDLEASLYRTVQREELGGVHVDWEQLLRGSVLGATRLSLSLLPGVGAVLGKGIEEAQKAFTGKDLNTIFDAVQRERRKIYRDHIQSLEQFQDKFQKLIQKQVTEKERRLVVFVDDLDRCLPEKAIEVLEAIKLFLDVEGCLFFLGVDRGVIEQGIRVKYKGFLDAVNADSPDEAAQLKKDRRIPITGDDYLEKIVQLPFHLLPLDESRVREFIAQNGDDLPDRCADIFAAGLEANPRKVKRALNIFRLLRELAELRRDEFTVEGQPLELQPQLLAKIVVIQSRHHKLYNDLVETPLLLPELEDLLSGGSSLPSTPAIPLSQPTTVVEVRESQNITLNVDPPVQPATPATLLDKYRDSRQLRRLLLAGDVFFAERPLAEVKLYLYLTTTTAESGQGKTSDPTMARWWEQLLSNDPTKIRSAVAEMRADSPDAWADTVTWLESLAGNPAEATRPAANAALAFSHDDSITLPSGDYPVGTRGSARRLEGFKINRYPVTNAWYRLFLADDDDHATPDGWQDRWYPAGQGSWPVTGVSWRDAEAFCRWAGKRLSKADEWQAAADQLSREELLQEWVAAPEGSGPLVMPGRQPEQAESKQPNLGFRVAE